MGLKDKLKMTRDFQSLDEEASLNLYITVEKLKPLNEAILKPRNLTSAQYNILRILKGAGPSGHRCAEISERMLQKDPDITRLLDRMVKKKLVQRKRSDVDRRVVRIYLSEAGFNLLEEVTPRLHQQQKELFSQLSNSEKKSLIRLLEKIWGNLL